MIIICTRHTWCEKSIVRWESLRWCAACQSRRTGVRVSWNNSRNAIFGPCAGTRSRRPPVSPAKESFHHCIRIFPGITFPRTESLMAAVSTLNALMANAAGLLLVRDIGKMQ